MIDRYSICLEKDKLANWFGVAVPDFYKPRYNAAPTQLLPVITSDSPEGLSLFYWGKPPEWAKNKNLGERIINIKAEQLTERPVLKKALLKRRCMIPADGFYLWRKVGTKTQIPYRYMLQSEEPFAIAGVWEEFENETGDVVHTFAIITRPEANTSSEKENRLPVILTQQHSKSWINESAPEHTLTAILSNRDVLFKNYSVSPQIRSMEVDNKTLIIPVPPADQYGNLTLFD